MAPGGKATSEGQKVTLGQNAPVSYEGTGAVASDSLAAESQAFREANHAEPRAFSHEQLESTQPSEEVMSSARAWENEPTGGGARNVAEAPSYVSSQFRDTKGPHGKNITEDDSIGTEDRTKNASFAAKIGSKDDPSLLAEKKFAMADSVPAQSIGVRQKGLDTATPYDNLNSSERA